MSLVLNMIGGGGSFTATDAILRVQAPAQSTVTISKGATTKSDFGHENMLDPTVYDYYFIIHQSQFDSINPWTVTASLEQYYDAVDTIIIDSSDEYDVVLQYKLFLYDLGNENISVTGGLSAYPYGVSSAGSDRITPTVTRNQSSIRISSGTTPKFQAFVFASSNPINVTSYSVAKIVVTAYSDGSTSTDQAWLAFIDELKDKYEMSTYTYINSAREISLDVSNMTGLLYPIIGFGGTNSFSLTFSRWWLE